MDRDTLGQIVRSAWVSWASEQPDPKPSWLVPWDELSEPDKEADRRIGETVAESVRRDMAATGFSAFVTAGGLDLEECITKLEERNQCLNQHLSATLRLLVRIRLETGSPEDLRQVLKLLKEIEGE